MNTVILTRNPIIRLIATFIPTQAGFRTAPVQNIENRKKPTYIKLRSFAISFIALFAMACASEQIPMYNIHDQSIPRGLTQEQVGEKIKLAAKIVGWSAEESSPGRINSTYRIRGHTVVAAIRYTENAYSIDYESSYHMKVYCTEEDKSEARSKTITTGPKSCPGGVQPAYIHQNYQDWIDELNGAIRMALKD